MDEVHNSYLKHLQKSSKSIQISWGLASSTSGASSALHEGSMLHVSPPMVSSPGVMAMSGAGVPSDPAMVPAVNDFPSPAQQFNTPSHNSFLSTYQHSQKIGFLNLI